MEYRKEGIPKVERKGRGVHAMQRKGKGREPQERAPGANKGVNAKESEVAAG